MEATAQSLLAAWQKAATLPHRRMLDVLLHSTRFAAFLLASVVLGN